MTNTTLKRLFAAAMLGAAFAAPATSAQAECSITVNNGRSQALTLKITREYTNGTSDSFEHTPFDAGANIVIGTTDDLETYVINVVENGTDLGTLFIRDEELKTCLFNGFQNQPICKSMPGPGELTIVENGRNCF